jgi:lysophospholipase L1-like esterase
MRRFAGGAFGAAVALLLWLIASTAGAAGTDPACQTPAALLSLQPGLAHVAARLAKRDRLTILAIGSSSTEGVGASSPAASYPSRLEVELRRRFPGIDIRVVNRGRGGEDAPEGVVRLERDVVAEDPDLVIWQVGTNAALRGVDPAVQRAVLRRGIALIRESAADVVLMDLQYAPRVLAAPAHEIMEKLIAEIAERDRVGLFRRFEIMRYWMSAAPIETAPPISADGLHMTDRSYACLAAALAEAIARNWQRYQAERPPAASLARGPGATDSETSRKP